MFGQKFKSGKTKNPGELYYDPVRFVLQYGRPYHILRMSRFIGNLEVDIQALYSDFLAIQNEDGGWPWRWKEGKPSGLAETGRAIDLMILFGENKSSDVIKKAFEFITSQQRSDGGWSENKQLQLIIPRKWYWTSTRYSCTWITAAILRGLISAGYLNNIFVMKGLEFLKKSQNENGGWPSHTGPDYPFGSDLSSMDEVLYSFLSAGYDRKSKIILKLEESTLALRDQWKTMNFSGSVLAILNALGYSSKSEYVRDLLQILIESQKIDGGWSGKRISPSDPWYTTYCLEQLYKYSVKYK